MNNRYRLIGIGGTFDLLHKGHKDFLRFVLSRGDKVLIGLTTDAFAASRKLHGLQSFSKRKEILQDFLREIGALERVEIGPLSTVHIPEEWEERAIDALFVTADSEKGAQMINKKRVDNGKEVLPIVVFPLTDAADGLPISSTRIREGVINREGESVVEREWFLYSRSLPDTLRASLQEPFGEIVDAATSAFSEEERLHILAVGDVTVTLFHARNILPRLSVVDLLVERNVRYKKLSEMPLQDVNLTYSLQNTPGQISAEAFRVVRDAFIAIGSGKTVLIHVEGEEDLIVLPVILLAPLDFIVCYGQPKKGTVKVRITESLKMHARDIVGQFLELR